MSRRVTELYEQYQHQETHLETITRQLDLQKQLADTQAKKIVIEYEAEKQELYSRQRALELQMEPYEKEILLLQENNRSLEAQGDIYKSKYTDLETTMSESNKVFDAFKGKMSKISKQLRTLQGERNDLTDRWQTSVYSLATLYEQHMKLSAEQSALEKRLLMLQKLCRQLQKERGAFLKQLRDNNIEPQLPIVEGDGKEQENNVKNGKDTDGADNKLQDLTLSCKSNECKSGTADASDVNIEQ